MKICLAGTSAITDVNKDYVKNVKYLLESFYSIKEWQIPFIKSADLFLLDSGAFTMFTKGHNLTEKDWDDYVTNYINFINKYDVKYFFELDVDRILGIKKVEEIRARIERETGKKCIPVWHKERGWKYFEKMCEEYDYVAIGGIAKNPNGKQIEKLFPYFIKCAHKHKCKIHGLGYTSANGLRKYHFDTVDSIAWKSANIYGNMTLFGKDGSMKQYHRPEGTRLKSGENYSILELHQLKEWIKFQEYADKHL